MTPPIPVSIHGIAGRMGQALARVASETNSGVRVVSALGRDARRVPIGSDGVMAESRVLIDFSHADGFDAALDHALGNGTAFVSGTTGLDDAQQARLDSAAVTIPVLWSANFSLGVAILSHLVRSAARALPDWQCDILEVHHRQKRDAPSGTALALGRAVADARGIDFAMAMCTDRTGIRGEYDIGFASLRAGDTVGEHSVWFTTMGERIELAHRATDRENFARGALAAAEWIVDRAPGRYSLDDMLGTRCAARSA